MLVVSCASRMTSAPKIITVGLPIRAISATGSQIASPKITTVALVTATPMNANAVIVAGSPSAWPSACDRWLRAYRVKSGMFRLSVTRSPTFAVNPAGKSCQNGRLSLVCSRPISLRMWPSPPPRKIAQPSSSAPPASSSGADQPSSFLMPSRPRTMIATWTSQKMPNAIQTWPGTPAQPGHAARISVSSASPPIQVWMPNQPQATSARRTAGTLAPRTPKLARHSTGNDTPYWSRRARSGSWAPGRWRCRAGW